ncbi:hypothetical protein ES676_14330 [Bizionia saleffrena]|uniref:Porin n=1 Tax=Bizionia saleffrena TaxID=291189 RepID=A0A8H2LCN2_9FLAO|nr:hypothetical protein [Bizionia saleffrena]TYB69063.1 hypothetical protein ES676_14330 [Bizionia saleffrena]
MLKKLTILFLISNFAFAQNDSTTIKTIGFNSEFSYKMLDQNQNLRKVNILLEERKRGTIKNNSLTIGTSLISILDYQHSNTDSKFGYLMRHPTANNQIGKEVSEAVIHSFQLSLTATINSWLSTHVEILYNPQQAFGAGTITSLERNQLQLRKGFVVIGNLETFPLYGALGKMDAPFGQMGSVNPFTNSTTWHAFAGLGYGAQIGYKKGGLHTKLMAVQGGAQFRAMHTPVGNNTKTPSKINNYVADLNYAFNILNKVHLLIGASYLRGSAYCQDFPVTHFSPCNDNNPAYTYYGTVTINERLTIKGGFAKTTKIWKGTHNPTPPLDVFEASKVSALDFGAKYDLNQNSKIKYTLSGEFSNFKAGPKGAPWERQNQMVLGFASLIKKSSKLFLEVFRTEGYAPLNFISGSNDFEPFTPGISHSERDANSIGFVLGAQVSF